LVPADLFSEGAGPGRYSKAMPGHGDRATLRVVSEEVIEVLEILRRSYWFRDVHPAAIRYNPINV